MAFTISGFGGTHAEKKQIASTYEPEHRKHTPRKSLVQVRFPGRGMALSYYNDEFDLKVGDRVYVDGKLEGQLGYITDVNYNFKIKLSDYKKVIAVVDTEVHGQFFLAGSHFITFDPAVLPMEQITLWFKAPAQDDEEYVSNSDDTSFRLDDFKEFKVNPTIADRGHDSGKYTCDKVAIKVIFYCTNASAAKAAETMKSQCEKFLQRLSEHGVDVATIRLQEDSIDQPSHRHEDKAKASRTLKFDCYATATINNLILKIIQDEHLDADVSTDYYLSNEDELRRKLRSEAMADSRDNAELLAQAANKTIIGVDTIDMCNNPSRVSHIKSITVDDSADDIFCLFSKKLSMPTRDIEETVEVTWLLG